MADRTDPLSVGTDRWASVKGCHNPPPLLRQVRSRPGDISRRRSFSLGSWLLKLQRTLPLLLVDGLDSFREERQRARVVPVGVVADPEIEVVEFSLDRICGELLADATSLQL